VSTIALVIPSYGRPTDLERVLQAARTQTRPFDDIVVALRVGDSASADIATRAGVRVVTVTEPGVIAAMVAGVASCTSTYVAFTDDDAVPPPSWAALLLARLDADPTVVGVGGRDVLYDRRGGDATPRPTTLTTDVGRFTWTGRLRGNHHCGTGEPTDVVVLKGVNAAYRRSGFALPTFLRGTGAQAHFELAVGSRLRAQGGRLLYDPQITVDHFPAPRVGADQRGAPADSAVEDSIYNLLRATPPALCTRRYVFTRLIGDGAFPGLVIAVVALLTGRSHIWRRWRPTQRGLRAAWADRALPETWFEVQDRSDGF
jgi:GT2 family glycosyltransferase